MTKQFWDVLSASQILSAADLRELNEKLGSPENQLPAATLAQILVSRNILTRYQAKVILANQSGPFEYGPYLLTNRLNDGTENHQYQAIHRPSQYHVILEFFSGQSDQDLEAWTKAERAAIVASQIDHPNLLAIHQPVILPEYRFVVQDQPIGALLADKLPRKSRLPWQQACSLMAQVADGLSSLHRANLVHGAVSPRSVFTCKQSSAQLQYLLHPDLDFEIPAAATPTSDSRYNYLPPEWSDSFTPTISSDIYAWGCTLVRVISGRPAFQGITVDEIMRQHRQGSLPDLSKYDLPEKLIDMISQLLKKEPDQRPTDLQQLSQDLSTIAGDLPKMPAASADLSQQRKKFLASLQPFTPTNHSKTPIELAPAIDTRFGQPKLGSVSAEGPSEPSLLESADQRKKQPPNIPLIVMGSLFLFSLFLIGWVFHASRTILPSSSAPNIADFDAENAKDDSEPAHPPRPDFSLIPEPDRPILIQDLINNDSAADDNDSLWESPTQGAPIDLSGLPPAPKLIFCLRPHDLLLQPEGQRVLQSMGEEFQDSLSQWESKSGFKLDEISQLILSFHSTTDFQYQTSLVVTLDQPVSIDRLLDSWNHPVPIATINGLNFFESTDDNLAFYILDQPDDPNALVSRFAVGPSGLIRSVADQSGNSLITGSIRSLSRWADRDRHLNILYLRPALFNDEGQKLMAGQGRELNRKLSLLLPDTIKGGLISLHLDRGTYFEIMFDRHIDLSADDLLDSMSLLLRKQRDELTQFVAQLPGHPYWDQVRLKYDNMLSDFVRNMRWDVEHGEVTANCWLPPMAAHNLIGASEHVLAFSQSTMKKPSTSDNQSQLSIQQILATKRDLILSNPPDLNLLMAEIAADTNEELSNPDFSFQIRLIGADLEKEGITQNQRTGELNFQQIPLSEILTQIMVLANPSKDIAGPHDPNCKLVWVVADDPERPGQQAVLITTRAAADQKSYTLPIPFQVKQP